MRVLIPIDELIIDENRKLIFKDDYLRSLFGEIEPVLTYDWHGISSDYASFWRWLMVSDYEETQLKAIFPPVDDEFYDRSKLINVVDFHEGPLMAVVDVSPDDAVKARLLWATSFIFFDQTDD